MTALKISPRFLCILSDWLGFGLYGRVCLLSMFSDSHISSIAFARKLCALSEIIPSHRPNYLNIFSSIALITVSAFVFFTGISHTYLVKLSLQVSMYSFPSFVIGRGPK